MHEEPHHGTYRHGDVVGQPVISQRFAATGGGGDVDHPRIARDGHRTERQSVHHAQHDEQRERTGHDITGKDTRKDEIGEDVERFAGESIQQIAGERTDGQCGERIAREGDSQ